MEDILKGLKIEIEEKDDQEIDFIGSPIFNHLISPEKSSYFGSPSQPLVGLAVSINKVMPLPSINKPYRRRIPSKTFVEDTLDFGRIVKQECNRKHLNKFSKLSTLPFQRLQNATQSASTQGQSRLIRCTSTDEEAQEFNGKKNDVINEIVSNLYSCLPSARDSHQPQLQKELILANSKSLAKERLRDIALSIHNTEFKEDNADFFEVKQKVQNHRRGKTTIEDIVAALLARDDLNGSLAECTDIDLTTCGRKLERHRRKKDQVVHIPEDQKVMAAYVIDEHSDELEDTIAGMHWSDMKGYENVNVCFRLAAAKLKNTKHQMALMKMHLRSEILLIDGQLDVFINRINRRLQKKISRIFN